MFSESGFPAYRVLGNSDGMKELGSNSPGSHIRVVSHYHSLLRVRRMPLSLSLRRMLGKTTVLARNWGTEDIKAVSSSAATTLLTAAASSESESPRECWRNVSS